MSDEFIISAKKPKKALYGQVKNVKGYSTKTIKCNKEMMLRVEFTEGREGAGSQLTMHLKNNLDGTATLTIRGSQDIDLVDNR